MKQEWIAVAVVVFTIFSVQQLSKLQIPWVTRMLDWFPSILFAYVIPALFTHTTRLDLSKVYLHTLSRDWIIPLAVLMVMSALPFRQLKIVGIKPIVLFAAGSFTIAVLPVLLVSVFSEVNGNMKELFIMDGYWKGLVPIVGGWIGGSTSQLVLKELVGTDEGLFLSILVLDNILVNIWTIMMFQFIKRSHGLNKLFHIRDDIQLMEQDADQRLKIKMWKAISLIIVITAITNFMLSDFLTKIVLLSILGLVIGNLIPNWNTKDILRIGGLAIVAIMAILGLKLDFENLSLPLPLVGLVITWLLGHFVVMMTVAVFLRINIAWVAIGSMANLGGISTAPAVTSAYNKSLMPHAVLLAILSMVTGTAWGMFTIYLFGIISS